ncbi:uncharacterized protein LOC111387653, partial [Olea europaea var. sylvestris]|uniref:uncharacterized protein LOC111387653 n=1 Tax=Olea europaea var. sylvestris TaxID=158386 RepID=UPI000C1D7E1B
MCREVPAASRRGRGIPQSLRAFGRIMSSDSQQELNALAKEAEQHDGRLARNPFQNKRREIEAHQLLLSQIAKLIEEYDLSIKVTITGSSASFSGLSHGFFLLLFFCGFAS